MISELLAALGGGAGVAALLKIISVVLDLYVKRTTTQALEAPSRAKGLAEDHKSESGASQVLILKATNGGKEILTDSPTYSWLMEHTDGAESFAGRWKEQLIDAEYSNILTKAIQDGPQVVLRGLLKKDSLLFNLFTVHGIECSIISVVRVSRHKVIYTSTDFATQLVSPERRADALEESRAFVNKLKEVYR